MKIPLHITVNGQPREILVEPTRTLLETIRVDLGLTGSKEGCGKGNCGACTVLLNGMAVNSCLVLAVEAEGQEVLTIEGLSQGNRLHPLQQAFLDQGAVQCGFCTPGVLLLAKSLLDTNPHPSEQEIRTAIAGNLCRCTGYDKIVRAIVAASKQKVAP
ncbi:MAG: (2Fe-2S)-binding protein [Chloroflexi bacterium]|nr:(2Fe-2S)-binding protein [Chloroflexota bacterium]